MIFTWKRGTLFLQLSGAQSSSLVGQMNNGRPVCGRDWARCHSCSPEFSPGALYCPHMPRSGPSNFGNSSATAPLLLNLWMYGEPPSVGWEQNQPTIPLQVWDHSTSRYQNNLYQKLCIFLECLDITLLKIVHASKQTPLVLCFICHQKYYAKSSNQHILSVGL